MKFRFIKKSIENISAFLLLCGVVLTLINIFFRYIVGHAIIWGDELAIFLFIWMIFAVFPCLTYENNHLTMGAFVDLINKRSILKNIIFYSYLFLNIATSLFMLIVSISPIKIAFLTHRYSNTGMFPMWVIYLIIPLSFLLNINAILSLRFSKSYWRSNNDDRDIIKKEEGN